jgi:hypothetical protein
MVRVFTFFAGRRGAIAWRKSRTAYERLDYDTHVAIGFVMPFIVLEPLHTFYWGGLADRGRAIPLHPERGFRLRAYLEEWSSMSLFVFAIAPLLLTCFALVRWIEEDRRWVLLAILAGLSAGVFVAAILTHRQVRRLDQRERDIRLLLGTHTWGSSDPAYWHPDLLDDVIEPADRFGVKTFLNLARRHLEERDWCRAMWAARIAAALEDEQQGESLTSKILEQPAVRKVLGQLRKDPSRRDELLGEPPPLSTWVRGVPERHIFAVG